LTIIKNIVKLFMSILPKNRSLSNLNYNKNKKDIFFDNKLMFDIEIFFKEKEEEMLQKIARQNMLNEKDDFVDKDIIEKTNSKKRA